MAYYYTRWGTFEFSNRADLDDVGMPVLLDVYNRLTGKKTTKFASAKKGKEQTWKAIEENLKSEKPGLEKPADEQPASAPPPGPSPEATPTEGAQEAPAEPATDGAAKPKKAKPKPPTEGKKTRKRLETAKKIKLKCNGNPFREGSDVFDRWVKAGVADGKTVEQLIAKGFRRGDIRWSIHKGYMELVNE